MTSLVIDALPYEKNKAFGFQEYLFNLLTHFHSNRYLIKHERIILVCSDKSRGDFLLYEKHFEIVSYPVSSLISRLIIQFLYPIKLKLKEDDVILNLGNYSSLFKFCKNILVIHDLLYLRKELLPNLLMRLHRKIYIPVSLNLADAVIAISEFTKDEIIANFGFFREKKIYVIYNYFNFEKFGFQFEYDKKNQDYFLSVSSSAYHKNSITVLKAFEIFCTHDSSKKLYFVGKQLDPYFRLYYSNLSEIIKSRIVFFSNISNIELGELYNNCLAYISASKFEGLGMPIVEAMFFNRKLILSDISVFKEIAYQNTFFFNPNSFEDLSKIMLTIDDNFSENSNYILNKFSSNNTSNRYINIINSI